MRISLSEVLLIMISLWGVGSWLVALVKDFIQMKHKGACVIRLDARFNYYHVLGIIYLLLILAFKDWGMTPWGYKLVTGSFLCLSLICIYRAIRKQGIYENAFFIPEQICKLDAIRDYKWVKLEGADFTCLYLNITYTSGFSKNAMKILRWHIPNEAVAKVNDFLKKEIKSS